MIRALVAIVVFGMAWGCCMAQQGEAPQAEKVTLARPVSASQQIEMCEGRIRTAESAHADARSTAALYGELGAMYQKAGGTTNAEAALKHEIGLLHGAPPNEMAAAVAQLAVVHVMAGDMHAAEKEQVQVLHLREKAGDSEQLALTWNDLADLYVRMGHFEQALNYAERAVASLGEDKRLDVNNRIAMRQTLGFALCGAQRCGESIKVLGEAAELARVEVGPQTVDAGVAEYLLGRAYWQSGEMQPASAWMARGIAKLKTNRTYGRAPYEHAMLQYAEFLREHGTAEQVATAERDLRMENSTVDVSALSK
jgi:tetratricopeptide (TPR) repeat protein